ncbi:MAG: hypothetical protein K2W95_24785 [Candidatus Obscuribacterales bacterium]|nr:hypothetical protein [Candidatus Obscuribacterales bacterium]
MKLNNLAAVACAFLFCGIALAACGNGTTVVSSDGKSSTTVDSNGAVIKGTSGDASYTMNTGSTAVYPATFQLPQYPGSTVNLTLDSKLSQSNNSGEVSDSVMLITPDSSNKVMEFYKAWMESNGWKVVNQVDMGSGNGALTGTKDTKTANAMIMSTPKGSGVETSVTLTVQGK